MSGFFVEFRKDIYTIEFLRDLNLNGRQLNALVYFKSQKEIVTSDYVKKFNVNARTARRDLIELVEKEILIKRGDNKSSKYYYL